MSWDSRWGPLKDRRRGAGPTRVHRTTTTSPRRHSALGHAPLVPDLLAPMGPKERVAVVLGTYNRIDHLREAIDSVRLNAGVTHHFIVVDGGSADGSRRWLADQQDVTLVGQRGPLTGAVAAFNLGFALAVERGYDYVFHFNDDAALVTPGGLGGAMRMMESDSGVGAVAFEHDFRGLWGFENIHGYIYPNFGLVRREAGIQVAAAQGDETGRAWWNPIYHTYAADSEFGCWLHRMGWKVSAAIGLRVRDAKCDDMLRKLNRGDDPDRPDSKLFWSRWPKRRSIEEAPCG